MAYILAELDRRGIEYIAVRNGETSIFDHARREKLPVYVQVPGHAYVVLRLTPRYAYIVNNFTAPGPWALDQAEKASKDVYKVPRDYFLRQRWTGSAFCLKCRRKRKDQPAAPPIVVKPLTPPADAPQTPPTSPAAPAVDLAPQLAPVNEALAKLTEANVATAKAVGDLAGKVGAIQERLAAVEKAKCACPGPGAPSTTPSPPPQVPPCQCKDHSADLEKIRADMQRLRNSLKGTGTVSFRLEPQVQPVK